VDFAAMLSNMKAARTKYGKLAAHNRQVKRTLGCQQGAAAAGLMFSAAAVSVTAAAEAAAGGLATGASRAQLRQQQLGGVQTDGANSRPQSGLGPAAAAAAAAAAANTAEHGAPASEFASGRSIGIAGLLQ
jgi:hypothetical protein